VFDINRDKTTEGALDVVGNDDRVDFGNTGFGLTNVESGRLDRGAVRTIF
jgi:hypothetical protein